MDNVAKEISEDPRFQEFLVLPEKKPGENTTEISGIQSRKSAGIIELEEHTALDRVDEKGQSNCPSSHTAEMINLPKKEEKK